MGLTDIQHQTRAMEIILGKIRSREMEPDSGIFSKLPNAAATAGTNAPHLPPVRY